MKLKWFILFLFFPMLLSAQKQITLKKKYLGTYSGEIAAYLLEISHELIQVDPATIQVQLTSDSVYIEIGQHALKGSYQVLLLTDSYYLLDCRMENQLAGERILVYKKGNKIMREGLYPQPNSFLAKE